MERLEPYFDALAASITPLKIELDRVYHAQWSGYGILGLSVKETSALVELHNRINRELQDLFEDPSAAHDGEGYHFHLTIELGKVEGADVFKHYYDELETTRVDLSFTAREVALFYYSGIEPGTYTTYKVLGLGSEQR
jgi:2'-5' RNA ligase